MVNRMFAQTKFSCIEFSCSTSRMLGSNPKMSRFEPFQPNIQGGSSRHFQLFICSRRDSNPDQEQSLQKSSIPGSNPGVSIQKVVSAEMIHLVQYWALRADFWNLGGLAPSPKSESTYKALKDPPKGTITRHCNKRRFSSRLHCRRRWTRRRLLTGVWTYPKQTIMQMEETSKMWTDFILQPTKYH